MEENKKKRTKEEAALLNTIIEQIDKLVDNKLSGIKLFIPFIFVVVTAVLSFILREKVPADQKNQITVYIIAIALLLIAFIALLVSYKVKPFYPDIEKETLEEDNKIDNNKNNVEKTQKEQEKKPVFSIYNIKSYWDLSLEEFEKEIELKSGCILTNEERIKVQILKQKVNEYKSRNNGVNVAYWIIIISSMVLIASCVYILFWS